MNALYLLIFDDYNATEKYFILILRRNIIHSKNLLNLSTNRKSRILRSIWHSMRHRSRKVRHWRTTGFFQGGKFRDLCRQWKALKIREPARNNFFSWFICTSGKINEKIYLKPISLIQQLMGSSCAFKICFPVFPFQIWYLLTFLGLNFHTKICESCND